MSKARPRLADRLFALAVLAAAFTSGASAEAATPGGGKCLWDALPAATQAAYQSNYVAQGTLGLSFDAALSAHIAANYKTCGFTVDSDGRWALRGYTERTVAERHILLVYGVTPETLEAIWTGLPPEARALYASEMTSDYSGAPPDPGVITALMVPLEASGKTSPDAISMFMDLVAYADGRVFQQMGEGAD